MASLLLMLLPQYYQLLLLCCKWIQLEQNETSVSTQACSWKSWTSSFIMNFTEVRDDVTNMADSHLDTMNTAWEKVWKVNISKYMPGFCTLSSTRFISLQALKQALIC